VSDARAALLVTGGARSGKSRYALERAMALPPPRVFIATAEPGDAEMAARIRDHHAERGDAFATVEEPRAVAAALARAAPASGVVVIDCLTLWMANLSANATSPVDVERAIDALAAAVATSACPVVVVTNEIGSGIIPFVEETRRFRDLLGFANQRVAGVVDSVVLMVAGQPLVVKPATRDPR
jgi:adenosylcobinamide kinase/adenosylcobinamide-phosphate guanylyltransferase